MCDSPKESGRDASCANAHHAPEQTLPMDERWSMFCLLDVGSSTVIYLICYYCNCYCRRLLISYCGDDGPYWQTCFWRVAETTNEFFVYFCKVWSSAVSYLCNGLAREAAIIPWLEHLLQVTISYRVEEEEEEEAPSSQQHGKREGAVCCLA